MFSELALMVVDKKLFVRHFSEIFNDTSVLMSFVEPRITLRMFWMTAARPVTALSRSSR